MTKFERIDKTKSFSDRLTEFQKAYYKENPNESVWVNDKYIVHVRKDLPMKDGSNTLLTHLSVRNNDNTAIRDWRDMQYIKNELVGEENEGFELYPRESRLVDTANQFHIWVFQKEENGIPIGFEERFVTDLMNHPQHKSKMKIGGSQRSFDIDRKPLDNYKSFKRMVEAEKNILNNS